MGIPSGSMSDNESSILGDTKTSTIMPALELDPFDRLLEACRNSSQYPWTLLKKTISSTVLEWYRAYLNNEDNVATLFNDAKQLILLWEMCSSEKRDWKETPIRSRKDLEAHLIREDRDPKCRHIFIESDHSRAPLNCSVAMLKLLLTYLQVDPAFLDYLFNFGDQEDPLDACLSHFQADDALIVQDRLPFLASLGRSGRELRHSFLLRSIEQTPEATEMWSVRQVVVYHSFDVVNGRTLWITVKGNNLLQQRIMEDSTDLPVFRAAMDGDVVKSLEAALATHMIFLHWCEKNWRWFVRDIEERIRPILVKAKTVPVDRQPHFTQAQQSQERDATTGVSSSYALPKFVSEKTGTVSTVKALRRYVRGTLHLPSIPTYTLRQSALTTDQSALPEGILVLEMFNYKDLQALNVMGGKLEEVTLILELNIKVLEDLYEYYKRVSESEDLGDSLRGSIGKTVSHFLLKVRHTIRSLETRKTQIVSLNKRLQEGKSLYENLLQFRSLQVSRIFAEHGHRSAIIMRNIAYRTERETVSMHIITVVTLLFLPATFLATFFQSGNIQFSEAQDLTSSWRLRTDVFTLFISIAIPMTTITLLGWLIVSNWGRIRSRKRLLEDARAAALVGKAAGSEV